MPHNHFRLTSHSLLGTLLLLASIGCNSGSRPHATTNDPKPSNPNVAKKSTAAAGTLEQIAEDPPDNPIKATATFDLESASTASLAELDRSAKGRWFYYLGSDDKWHYFLIKGTYYRLEKSEPIPPIPPKRDGKTPIGYVALPMIFENGKLAPRYPTDSFSTGRF